MHLVGHSWGAMLAAGYLGQYPEFVTKVVLAEPGELTNASPKALQARQATARDVRYYRILIPTIFETFHMTPPDADARTDYIFGRMSQAFVGSSASSYRCADASITEVMPGVPVPPRRFGATAFNAIFGEGADLSAIAANAGNYTNEVLFIASACNNFIGEAFQRRQMTIFPNPRLVVIPDAGHNMITENPVDTLRVIRDYFADAP